MMRVDRIMYRIMMLIVSLVGAGIGIDAHVTDTINRFYFHKHYPASTILMWSGGIIAVFATLLAERDRFMPQLSGSCLSPAIVGATGCLETY